MVSLGFLAGSSPDGCGAVRREPGVGSQEGLTPSLPWTGRPGGGALPGAGMGRPSSGVLEYEYGGTGGRGGRGGIGGALGAAKRGVAAGRRRDPRPGSGDGPPDPRGT